MYSEGKAEDEIDYIRTLERQDNKCLVHWWYYPDSYDNWIPASEVEVRIVFLVVSTMSTGGRHRTGRTT